MKLVFLHGAGSSSLSFYYQLRHFRNAKAIDLPGHPDGQPCGSIEGYLEWVRGFIKARRYKDIVLCGHSMGGAIAQLYALKYPEELKGIILMGTGAKLRVHPDYLERGRQPGEGSSRWLEGHQSYFNGVEPDLHQLLVQRAAQIGPAVELNDLLCCDRFDVMRQVRDIKLPTDIISGSLDEMTPVKYSDYLAENIAGSQEHIIPGANHFVQLQQHRKVNEKLEQFLARIK